MEAFQFSNITNLLLEIGVSLLAGDKRSGWFPLTPANDHGSISRTRLAGVVPTTDTAFIPGSFDIGLHTLY